MMDISAIGPKELTQKLSYPSCCFWHLYENITFQEDYLFSRAKPYTIQRL